MSLFRQRLKASIDQSTHPLKVIAHRSGYSEKYIRELKAGHKSNPTLACVESLATVLDLRPDYLAGWDHPT